MPRMKRKRMAVSVNLEIAIVLLGHLANRLEERTEFPSIQVAGNRMLKNRIVGSLLIV